MVLALVLLPAFAEAFGGRPDEGHGAGHHGIFVALAITFAKVGAFIAILLLVGPRVLPWTLRQVARTGSRRFSRFASLLSPWASHLVRPSSSRYPMPLALSSPAWFCMNPI
jgi:CPA2 family monovalent cation:H+ antiporter-2